MAVVALLLRVGKAREDGEIVAVGFDTLQVRSQSVILSSLLRDKERRMET